jgi:uncharacterized protein YyaL (SSP411 family)
MLRFSPNPNRANLLRWYDWGEEAFRVAQQENKPVMLFLSAFWCRYCQRMDEEAFSETENIALLRAYFISIRAENGQRPDLDVRYNQNGWPTIVFMTPLGEPIVAANYLSGEQFQDLLLRVYVGYQQSRETTGAANATQNRNLGGASLTNPSARLNESGLVEITQAIMALADRNHGGYGNGQKFIQTEPNDFLLSQYEATRNGDYLTHVCLTLDRMRENAIHDREEGGYFRTSTGPDWDQPHREKLLAEQAGLIVNCLSAYRVTRRPELARMAEDIIGYVNARLSDDATGAFYGCEDFLRVNGAEHASQEQFFTVIDKCVYTDANALAISAYLEAAAILQRNACKERALRALEFLRLRCRNPAGGMFHCFDGTAQLGGWLGDQVLMGSALLEAHTATGKREFLAQAQEMAEFIVARFKNPAGGYYDLETSGLGYLSVRLTLIELNGPAARFFLALTETTGDPRWREAAFWALNGFGEDFHSYGIHAAAYGRALAQYLVPPPSSSPAFAGEDEGGG